VDLSRYGPTQVDRGIARWMAHPRMLPW
jgi:hypothetical protein